MTLALFDQTLDLGADLNTLVVDAAQPHGFRFGLGGMTRIAEVIAPGGTSTISFASIPATFRHLLMLYMGQDTNAGGAGVFDMHVKINGDAVAANYTNSQQVAGSGAAASAASQAPSVLGAICGVLGGTVGSALAVGGGAVFLPGYANTSIAKFGIELSGAANLTAGAVIVEARCFSYKSLAAINALLWTAGGTNFAAGSQFTLFGIQ
jgi:hypothetical protein